MNLNNYSVILFSLAMFSVPSVAEDLKKHTFGIDAGNLLSINFDSDFGILKKNDTSTASLDFYYRYMFNNFVGVQFDRMVGRTVNSTNLINDTGLFNIFSELGYQSFGTAVYGQYQFNKNNHFYGKLGLASTKVSFLVDLNKVYEKEIGLYAATGWEYRFNSGWGLNLEYQIIKHNKFNASTIQFGTSFSF